MVVAENLDDKRIELIKQYFVAVDSRKLEDISPLFARACFQT